MVTDEESTMAAMPILCLAPETQVVDHLRRQFTLLDHGAAPRRILAQGARANDALRAALATPGGIDMIVLMSPPSVEMLDADVAERLRAVDSAVLALFGTEDEGSPPAFGHAWRRALGKSFVMFVYGAGADMANERPQAVAALVADFFTRGENFLVRIADDRRYE